jgi:arabinan endo-1,5-alpha-L-arabinosidase
MLSFLHILSLFLGFAGVIDAYANPLACSGVCGNSHDPAVIRRSSDGTYFRFSTGNKISVATASSLSGPWVAKRSAITGGSRINKKGKDDLWVCLDHSSASFGKCNN